MSKKNKPSAFRTDVTKFAHTVWLVSRGKFPARQDLHVALSRPDAEKWRVDNATGKRDRDFVYVNAAHVIFMNGAWWRVLANPLNIRVPLPPIPFVHPAAPKVEPLPLTTTRQYTWRQRLRILFTGQITITTRNDV